MRPLCVCGAIGPGRGPINHHILLWPSLQLQRSLQLCAITAAAFICCFTAAAAVCCRCRRRVCCLCCCCRRRELLLLRLVLGIHTGREVGLLLIQRWPLCDDAACCLQLGLLGLRVVAQVNGAGLCNGSSQSGQVNSTLRLLTDSCMAQHTALHTHTHAHLALCLVAAPALAPQPLLRQAEDWDLRLRIVGQVLRGKATAPRALSSCDSTVPRQTKHACCCQLGGHCLRLLTVYTLAQRQQGSSLTWSRLARLLGSLLRFS